MMSPAVFDTCSTAAPKRRGRTWLFASLLLLASHSVESLEEAQQLDPATGDIDGIAALAISPVEYEGKRARRVLNIPECQVRFVPVDNRNTERIHPCHTWFLEEPGIYEYWIEAPGLMSPFMNRLFYGRAEFSGRGMSAAASVAPAGRVFLPSHKEAAPHLQLRLLHAGKHMVEDFLRRLLTRRVATTDLGKEAGIRMPAGPAVAAIWDQSAEKYVAISRPFEVPGNDAEIVPTIETPPATSAHLIAEINYAQSQPYLKASDLKIRLTQQGVAHAPSLAVITLWTTHAIWYDLNPGPAELLAVTPTDGVEPVAFELGAGSIEHLSVEMQPLPTLTIDLNLPFALSDEPIHLGIRRVGGDEWFRHTEVDQESEVLFSGLPRGLYDLILETPVGPFRKQVEIIDLEHFETLAPDITVISGTVSKGDSPHRASLEFTSTTQRTEKVATDPNGIYELLSLESMRSVSIKFADSPFPPYVEYFPKALSGIVERDFEILGHEMVARVFDEVSGQGIENAQVIIRSTYIDRTAEPEDELRVVQKAVSEDDGLVLLPPIRPGTLELTARAPGYARQLEPVVGEIEIDVESYEFELPLEPYGSTTTVQLLLPGGSPASGSRVALFDSLLSGRALEEVVADAEGQVALPDRHAGLMALARHPKAGFQIRVWNPKQSNKVWILPLSGPDLTIQAVDRHGEPIQQRLAVALAVGNWHLSGRALAWLTGARPFTNPRGTWTIPMTPQTLPIGVLLTPWGSVLPPVIEPLFTPIPNQRLGAVDVPLSILE